MNGELLPNSVCYKDRLGVDIQPPAWMSITLRGCTRPGVNIHAGVLTLGKNKKHNVLKHAPHAQKYCQFCAEVNKAVCET